MGAELPPAALAALSRARVPTEAVSVVIRDPLTGQDLMRHNALRPMNPASIIKLVTTLAALERLGSSWTWKTPIWLDGSVTPAGGDGVLDGNLVIKGSGDPRLTIERTWMLLQRVRQMGVQEIRGDIVLDQSAFEAPAARAGDFDGEPLKPYNVQPRALMLNQRTVSYSFTPDSAAGVARITAEPPLAGVRVDSTVPLAQGPCQDWRGDLKAQWADPARVRFSGRYAQSCGERQWHVAHPDPDGFDARYLQALWSSMGGRLQGRVREGRAPDRAPTFEWSSPALADVVRDINRHSNNTMAQLLALTLAAQSAPAGTTVGAGEARGWLQQWAQSRLEPTRASADTARLPGQLVIDNGSGLSREQRASAEHIATLLQQAWTSPVLPDFISSLPATGAPDGTLRRWQREAGRAHLKTGSLRDVVGVAGYALAPNGQRRIVVVMIQHERAQEARPVLDAVVRWALDEAPVRSSPRPASP